jgi:hypothetical protein
LTATDPYDYPYYEYSIGGEPFEQVLTGLDNNDCNFSAVLTLEDDSSVDAYGITLNAHTEVTIAVRQIEVTEPLSISIDTGDYSLTGEVNFKITLYSETSDLDT